MLSLLIKKFAKYRATFLKTRFIIRTTVRILLKNKILEMY